ncbi:hypothetical protein [Vibrio cholerae]|uniref:hypothetical protein n=1 Tax=Vibrio cholerae TaxID=666 RepID=UPI00165824C1|nr:hypothetical protein [Vibrio cholerae]EGZ6889815.1 hypothetical protein [Vibrio cholerae]EJL6307309.1 hypothetical protein [Vibrio cholerae]MBC9069517.1 hypothetical protein [Vibrio cholerae]HAS4509446.1 hypothetical protein [Vibrio cholerae]HAS5089919.1 hypothetical protein [Vibrio cholerae]
MTTEILRIERKLKAFIKLFLLYGCIPIVVFPFAEEQTFRFFLMLISSPLFCCVYFFIRDSRKALFKRLEQKSKDYLLVYSQSLEVSKEERNVAISVLNKHYPGWSFESATEQKESA